MGAMNHNAILATTQLPDVADRFRAWLNEGELSEGVDWCELRAPLNRVTTFLIGPDGSKEWRQESAVADAHRAEVAARLADDNDEDGGSPWSWVSVGYGEFGQHILTGNCRNRYDDRPYAGVDSEDPEV